jgi:oligopeptide transport system substrate-binding protein
MSRCLNLISRGIPITVLTVVLFFSAWPARSTEVRGVYGGAYRIPLSSEPITLDPAVYSDIYSFNVAQNIFDGLVEFDRDLRVTPAIARRWKISRDQRTYTFHLREGVTFHNGRTVTAEDFVFSFTRLLDPQIKSPVASLFNNIQGAQAYRDGTAKQVDGLRAPDSQTLVIELEKPFAPFLSILAMINAKVVPREAMGPEFSNHPVGTGPFRFASWDAGKEIVLTANEAYFAGKPFLSSLAFKLYSNIDWDKIFEDFENGRLEHSIVPSQNYDMIVSGTSKKPYVFMSQPGLNLVYIGINAQLKPFDDPRVRQAINYAVDTQTIVKTITKRGSVPATGVLPPGIPGFDPHAKGYGYDPQKARQLLADAGYPGGEGIAPLEIWTVSKSESVQAELAAYQKYLADVGVQITPRVAENWKEFINLINGKKIPLFYAAWYADYPDADNFLYVLCHSTSKTNRMGYVNPEADRLLEEAREESDYMKRADLYQKIDKMVMNESPVISQHINSFNYVFQPWVKNTSMSPLGIAYLSFREVWLDGK